MGASPPPNRLCQPVQRSAGSAEDGDRLMIQTAPEETRTRLLSVSGHARFRKPRQDRARKTAAATLAKHAAVPNPPTSRFQLHDPGPAMREESGLQRPGQNGTPGPTRFWKSGEWFVSVTRALGEKQE